MSRVRPPPITGSPPRLLVDSMVEWTFVMAAAAAASILFIALAHGIGEELVR